MKQALYRSEKSTDPTIELKSERIVVQALGACEPLQILDYFDRNRAHLETTSPPHPPDFHTVDFWNNRIAGSRLEWREDSAYRFVLKSPHELNRVVGTVNLMEIVRGPFQACYMGYGIDYECEGKGLMTCALNLVIGYAFETLNLHRIMANHLVENKRSAAVLSQLGFQREAIAKAYLYINGAWRDHVLNSLTNPNWQNTF